MSSFAIVNLRDGNRKDLIPPLIPNDAFPVIENEYLFRGRIQKRSCFSRLGTGNSRLRLQIGTTGASPFAFTLTDNPITSTIAQFSIGNVWFTDPGGASPIALLSSNALYGGTLNRATGAVSLTHPVIGATAVYYYPGLPVMGLRNLEQVEINDESLLAFDTRYSYLYDNGTQDFIAANQFATTNNIFVWESTNSDLFWTSNYLKAFWATNNVPGLHAAQDADAAAEGDGIRWFSPVGNRWRNFNPLLTATIILCGALIIIPYKDRLVTLSTWEGTALPATNFQQRARWSQNGTPFYGLFPAGGSAQADAWRSDIVGKGGFIDAPTQEVIVSAEFIKDTLIVYFERSTWQLVYTGNETLPFIWQKINTELGCESTFSVVPFDSGVFAVGNYGIVSTDSTGVSRIDQKIPDEVFQIQSQNNGVKRVTGVRDYNAQLVYWAYPIQTDEDNDNVSYTLTYPNQVLLYNYLDGSWAEFDDSFTCFGYWQKLADATWATSSVPWETASYPWNSQVIQAKYPDVVAGNQRGFVFVYSQLQQLGRNVASLEISAITITSTSQATITIPDHNLTNEQYFLFSTISGVSTGLTNFENRIFKVTQATASTFVIETDIVGPPPLPFSGSYVGAGLVIVIPKPSLMTKEFNPFMEKGDSASLSYFDIWLDRTENGSLICEIFINSNITVPLPNLTGATPVGFTIINTFPEPAGAFSSNQERIFHRVYTSCYGSSFQLKFTLNDTQMRNIDIASSDITIHGLVLYVTPAGRLSYDV